MSAAVETIKCPRCKIFKNKEEFGKDSTKAKGISCWCKACKKTWRANHRKKYPEKAKIRDFAGDLWKHYRMTVEEYRRIEKVQKNRCACCGKHKSNFKRQLHVDHDHKTGKIRGLLCTQCNPGIGYFQHSVARLKMAIRYLERTKG